MALETEVLLKTIYAQLLKAKTLEEARQALRIMLNEEQIAYVEKSLASSVDKQ